MKGYIAVVALFATLSSNAFALRCGNELINLGDPLYKVQQNCKIISEYRVKNQNADILKLYIDDGAGAIYQLIFIDGVLNTEDFSRP